VGDGEGGLRKHAADALPVTPTRPLTKAEAEPILKAKYATSSAEDLSIELGGVPVPTIRTWAFRLKLTSRERIAQMARERNHQRAAAPQGSA